MSTRTPRRPPRPDGESKRYSPPPGLLLTPEQVLKYFGDLGVSVSPSVDVQAIIEATPELSIKFEDLGMNDAYIRKVSETHYEIAVNSRHHPNRQRFSMAHEYAHYLLHRDKIQSLPVGEQILHRNDERNRVEWQANDFAANLLMPSDLVSHAVGETGGNIKASSELLRISQDAFRYRLRSLGYTIK